jgi:hypothetical protein
VPDEPVDIAAIVKRFETHIYDADIAGMAQCVGELHERWSSLTENVRSHVLKLEAIFLSILKARTSQ